MKVIILVGTPGSGKSTIATTEFAHLTRVNQDELGTRERCLKAFNEALARGESIVLDRCNHSEKQRKEWMKIAKMYGASIHAVYLDIDPTLATKRIHGRINHPTIFNKDLASCRKIVLKFYHEIQPPTLHEGFDSVLSVRCK